MFIAYAHAMGFFFFKIDIKKLLDFSHRKRKFSQICAKKYISPKTIPISCQKKTPPKKSVIHAMNIDCDKDEVVIEW